MLMKRSNMKIFMVDLHAALRHHQMNENGLYPSLVSTLPVNPFNTAGEGRSLDYGALSPHGRLIYYDQVHHKLSLSLREARRID
jgi:hypothetical protein